MLNDPKLSITLHRLRVVRGRLIRSQGSVSNVQAADDLHIAILELSEAIGAFDYVLEASDEPKAR